MKVKVTKFMGEHRKLGRLFVGREIDVDQDFFEANKLFLEPVDDSVRTSDADQGDDDSDNSGEPEEPLNDNDETTSNPDED